MRGFSGQVSGTGVYRDAQCTLNVRVSYRARAGGNESATDRRREGARPVHPRLAQEPAPR